MKECCGVEIFIPIPCVDEAQGSERIKIMADVQVEIAIAVSEGTTSDLAVDASGVPADAVVGVPYSGDLVASGGTAPYSFAVSSGSLPDGLTLDPDTGTITGTPDVVGNFDAVIDVTDSAGAVVSARVSNSAKNKQAQKKVVRARN